MKKNKTVGKIIKRILIVIAILIALLFIALVIYTKDYSRPDEIASAIEEVTERDGGDLIMPKSKDGEFANENIGMIFYPGGKVDEAAYLPLISRLQEDGIDCIIVKMPFKLAVFGINKAGDLYDEFPEVEHWYMSGHSLGGVIGSSYAAKNQDKLDGLILMGSYVYGDYPDEDALIIYGENDIALDLTQISDESDVVMIEGGNHAGFGNYGVQKGDGELEITRDEQQDMAEDSIIEFIEENSNKK